MENLKRTNAQELGAKNRIIEELREELASRDNTILEERAERVRVETLNDELSQKYAGLFERLDWLLEDD